MMGIRPANTPGGDGRNGEPGSMGTAIHILGTILLLAACGSAEPPAVIPSPTSSLLQPPPIYALLGEREELELTSEQVVALDSVAQRVPEENRPLAERLRELRGEPANVPEDSPIADADVEAVVERIRANNLEAAAAVQAILTPEQRTSTCEIFQEPLDNGREREAPARLDSLRVGTGGILIASTQVWPWCVPAAPAEAP